MSLGYGVSLGYGAPLGSGRAARLGCGVSPALGQFPGVSTAVLPAGCGLGVLAGWAATGTHAWDEGRAVL